MSGAENMRCWCKAGSVNEMCSFVILDTLGDRLGGVKGIRWDLLIIWMVQIVHCTKCCRGTAVMARCCRQRGPRSHTAAHEPRDGPYSAELMPDSRSGVTVRRNPKGPRGQPPAPAAGSREARRTRVSLRLARKHRVAREGSSSAFACEANGDCTRRAALTVQCADLAPEPDWLPIVEHRLKSSGSSRSQVEAGTGRAPGRHHLIACPGSSSQRRHTKHAWVRRRRQQQGGGVGCRSAPHMRRWCRCWATTGWVLAHQP